MYNQIDGVTKRRVWYVCSCGHIAQDHNKKVFTEDGWEGDYSCDMEGCKCKACDITYKLVEVKQE